MEDGAKNEKLKDEMRNVLEEARMVIPGIQALFGFQMMAAFNSKFEELPRSGVAMHLVALGLLALSIALLMAPAAYHRLAERGQVSRQLIDLASRLITMGMVPLMLAVVIDIYEVVLITLDNAWMGVLGAAVTLGVFAGLWFVFPIARRKH